MSRPDPSVKTIRVRRAESRIAGAVNKTRNQASF